MIDTLLTCSLWIAATLWTLYFGTSIFASVSMWRLLGGGNWWPRLKWSVYIGFRWPLILLPKIKYIWRKLFRLDEMD